MGVSSSDVGYTSATTAREDYEVHNGHVVALGEKNIIREIISLNCLLSDERNPV
jgi:hypothetical protein